MGKIGYFVLGTLFGFGVTAYNASRYVSDEVTQQKNQLIEKYEISAKELNKIEKDIALKSPLSANKKWQRVLDSLETKAAVEKAYLEGAQMVRDSIKNANLQKAARLIK